MDHEIVACSDLDIAELTAMLAADEEQGMRQLDKLVTTCPGDARLHFLRGSLLADRREYKPACSAMRRAVALAPHYSVARFQLGLLLLTSGEPESASEVWGPLHDLPATDPFACFTRAMDHLIRDEFAAAIGALEDGIARNETNIPLSRDMELLIAELRRASDAPDDGSVASAADQLLRQAALKATKH